MPASDPDTTPGNPLHPPCWHLVCQVIDNFGDVGVLWRLARQLRDEYGVQVRFFIDDLDALAKLAPETRSIITPTASRHAPYHDLAPRSSLFNPNALPQAPARRLGGRNVANSKSTALAAPTSTAPSLLPSGPGSPQREPHPPPPVTVCPLTDDAPIGEGAEVVVLGFQVRLPEAARRAWLQTPATQRPRLIQLDYLSAEDWVADLHGLTSLAPDGLRESFFYPGFGPNTGGLLLERGLLAERDRFLADPANRLQWLSEHGVQTRPDELLVSLLCYPQAPLKALLSAWLAHAQAGTPGQPCCLHLLAPGADTQPHLDGLDTWIQQASKAVHHHSPNHARSPSRDNAKQQRSNEIPQQAPDDTGLHSSDSGPCGRAPCQPAPAPPPRIRLTRLPFLPQTEFDHLLWSCDLNLVRGEDSWIRALWAGKPWLWQAYPQAESTHLDKLDAFLKRAADTIREADATTPRDKDAHRDRTCPLCAEPEHDQQQDGEEDHGKHTVGGVNDVDDNTLSPPFSNRTSLLHWQQAMRAWNSAPAAAINDVIRWLEDMPAARQLAMKFGQQSAADSADLASRLIRFVRH